MSFRSDVSFPERNLDDPNPPHSGLRNQGSTVRRQMADRDRHELWSVLRSFRQVYGAEALRAVIDDAAQS